MNVRTEALTHWKAVAVALALCTIAPSGYAADISWNAGNGDWSNPSNWFPQQIPSGTDHALLKSTDSTNRIVSYTSDNPSFELMNIDATGSGTMTLAISGGTLRTTGPQDFVGTAGRGAITQTGGTYWLYGLDGSNNPQGSLVLGGEPTALGTYGLSGNGTLTVATFVAVGGNGEGLFTQSAGTHNVGTNLNLGLNTGSNGTYELSGTGVLNVAGRENVGLQGDGVFNQSGGTNNVGDTLYIGRRATSTGEYNLSGGTLNAGNGIGNGIDTIGELTPGGTGTFNYTGGELNITGGVFANAGRFIMSGAGTRVVNGDVTNIAGGSVIGNGTITGTLLNDGGVIAPGLSPGRIDISEDFVFDGGVLEIEVAGLADGEFDVLNIVGSASFGGGTIQFAFIDGFLPQQDDVLNFLIADAVSGLDLVTLAYTGAAPGFEFRVTAGPDGLVFTALNDAVPEPATLVLLAVGFAGLGVVRRKKLAA